jgi:hypothetical protein
MEAMFNVNGLARRQNDGGVGVWGSDCGEALVTISSRAWAGHFLPLVKLGTSKQDEQGVAALSRVSLVVIYICSLGH